MRSPAAAALRGAETPREPPRPSAVKVRAMARLQEHRANGVFNSNSPLAISKAKTPRTSSGSGGARPKRSEEEKAARKTKAGNKRMHNLDIAEVCERHGACTVAEVEAVFAAKQKTAAEREQEDLLIAALKAQYKADIAEAEASLTKATYAAGRKNSEQPVLPCISENVSRCPKIITGYGPSMRPQTLSTLTTQNMTVS